MYWYLAKIVFRILCGDGQHMAQFDEQLRLVSANNKEEAFYKAQRLGALEEDTFFNKKDQLVQWKFINVCELYRLSELIDGAELYSKVDEKENAEAYIHMINQKATTIFLTPTDQLFQLA